MKKGIIVKNLKKDLKNVRSRLVCNYEGCGADDGWPLEILISENI